MWNSPIKNHGFNDVPIKTMVSHPWKSPMECGIMVPIKCGISGVVFIRGMG
jgi:hypothetical protein